MKAEKTKEVASLSARIKEEAQRLGFALVGISPVRTAPHEDSFAQWLRKGLGGELGYLKRTEALRRDPGKLVPWAVSVISVGMNYYAPMPRPDGKDESKGWISRYAWGDDYHDLVKERLESLLDRIRRVYPETCMMDVGCKHKSSLMSMMAHRIAIVRRRTSDEKQGLCSA